MQKLIAFVVGLGTLVAAVTVLINNGRDLMDAASDLRKKHSPLSSSSPNGTPASTKQIARPEIPPDCPEKKTKGLEGLFAADGQPPQPELGLDDKGNPLTLEQMVDCLKL